jgi:hypothetical protein
VTRVYYIKWIKGRVYPKSRRKGHNVAYVNDVHRDGAKVINTYSGIVEVPQGVDIIVMGEEPTTKPEDMDA